MKRGSFAGWVICVVLAVCVAALASCSKRHSQVARTPVVVVPKAPEGPTLPYNDIDFNTPLAAITKPKIYVYKSDRKLQLVNGDILVREYRVGLGPHPNGDKYFQGDGRTPEGEFYVCVKNPWSNYYKSLGLSYPHPKRAKEAFYAGSISPEDFACIMEANSKKGKPPWNTTLGGAIMIHGGGAQNDWTEGCVAVYNSAMDELFQVVSVGTPVEILP